MLPSQRTKHFSRIEAKPEWWLVDLKGKTLGRVATQIAELLRGKHKASFSPHLDNGDYVVAINANEINLTGKKWEDKKYYHHSGHMGGLRTLSATELLARHPEDLLKKAVKGMLPKNTLAHQMLDKLKIYPEAHHEHASQKPKPLPERKQ